MAFPRWYPSRPSYMGLLKYKTIGQVNAALKSWGFHRCAETSEGAAYVTGEYAKLLQEGKMENIITTCCPSVNELIEIYYPELIPFMAPVVSPMIAHGKLLKKEFGRETKSRIFRALYREKERSSGFKACGIHRCCAQFQRYQPLAGG